MTVRLVLIGAALSAVIVLAAWLIDRYLLGPAIDRATCWESTGQHEDTGQHDDGTPVRWTHLDSKGHTP
ncbi:hypothetical protein ACRYCC_26060 [Actinomadura scrupuli]|uniref:hypothetical protein n=1 Tax=Actinomadura scrupuli TaxID=559629 RepID=UPI003D95EC7B